MGACSSIVAWIASRTGAAIEIHRVERIPGRRRPPVRLPAADVALRTVRDYLEGETGIERATFVLRPSAVETFRRRLAAI